MISKKLWIEVQLKAYYYDFTALGKHQNPLLVTYEHTDLLVSCTVPFTVTSRLRFTLFTILEYVLSQNVSLFSCACVNISPLLLWYCAKSALGDNKRPKRITPISVECVTLMSNVWFTYGRQYARWPLSMALGATGTSFRSLFRLNLWKINCKFWTSLLFTLLSI